MFLIISPEEWGRSREKLEQALIQLGELRQRLDERDREARDFRRQLLLVVVAGLFAVTAALLTAVLRSVF
jgi:hypothetical protein